MIDRPHAASWNLSHLSFLSFWSLRRVALYKTLLLNGCSAGEGCGTTLHNFCRMRVVLGSCVEALWLLLMQPHPYCSLHAEGKHMCYTERLSFQLAERQRTKPIRPQQ